MMTDDKTHALLKDRPPCPLKGESCFSHFRGEGGFHIALLVLITAGLYWRSLGNEFLMLWDDQWMVFNSYTDTGFTPGNVRRILTDVYYGQYSPLNQFAYTLLYYVAGYSPVVYHGFCKTLFYVANLVLMLHFIPMSRFTVTCDRYLYVALLGPAALAGWWASCGLRKRRALTLAILIPYLLYLTTYTFIYQGRWDNSADLKREVRHLLREREWIIEDG